MDKIATCDIGSCSESLRAIWRPSLVPSATYSPGERVTSSLRSYDRMGHRQHRRTRGAHGRGSMFGWRVRGARPTRLWGNTGGVLPVGCAFAGRGFRPGRARLFADDRQRSPDLRLIAVGERNTNERARCVARTKRICAWQPLRGTEDDALTLIVDTMPKQELDSNGVRQNERERASKSASTPCYRNCKTSHISRSGIGKRSRIAKVAVRRSGYKDLGDRTTA